MHAENAKIREMAQGGPGQQQQPTSRPEDHQRQDTQLAQGSNPSSQRSEMLNETHSHFEASERQPLSTGEFYVQLVRLGFDRINLSRV